MTTYNVENGKVNATGITFTLLADHLPHVHIFLQIPVNQLKRFSRRRDASGMTVYPCFKRKLVNLCYSIRIWWAKVCVGVRVRGQSSTWKSCCVQCPAQTGAVRCTVLQLGRVRLKRTSFVVFSGLVMWMDCRFHWASCLYIITTHGVICGSGIHRMISFFCPHNVNTKIFQKARWFLRQDRNTRDSLSLSLSLTVLVFVHLKKA